MLTKKVAHFIQEHSLIQVADRVLVAYSGGPDSTALLLILSEMYDGVAALYVNHQLRGEESKKEERFVREFCLEKKIPLFVERIEWKRRPSNLEETARKRRYRIFAKVAQERGFDKVALAHHRDDSVETFLMHLIRGSGPRGLSGLSPNRDIYVRPMLDCTRQEILQYLEQNQISYVQDESNEQLNFTRNRIRIELIPYIEKHLNPAFSAAVQRAATWTAEQDQLLEKLLQPYKSVFSQTEDSWDLHRKEWLELDRNLQKALLKLLLRQIHPQFSSRNLETIIDSIQKKQNLELPGFLRMEHSRNLVHFRLKKERIGLVEVDVPFPGKYNFPASKVTLNFSLAKRTDFEPSPSVAYLDADRASFPLYIRNWKKGDSFRPLGSKGTKKLSDFFIDRKVPRKSRKMIPLVYKDDDLIWLAGYQIHQDYRVTDSTKRLLRIELSQG